MHLPSSLTLNLCLPILIQNKHNKYVFPEKGDLKVIHTVGGIFLDKECHFLLQERLKTKIRKKPKQPQL